MDQQIYIYNIEEFNKLLGLNTWNDVETQLEKDITRIKYNLDGNYINNLKDLWKLYGPLKMTTMKCLTQNVFYPGLKLLYDTNINPMFIQHPKYHHYIIKTKDILVTKTIQQVYTIDTITNDITLGESILIITTITPVAVSIEFQYI